MIPKRNAYEQIVGDMFDDKHKGSKTIVFQMAVIFSAVCFVEGSKTTKMVDVLAVPVSVI